MGCIVTPRTGPFHHEATALPNGSRTCSFGINDVCARTSEATPDQHQCWKLKRPVRTLEPLPQLGDVDDVWIGCNSRSPLHSEGVHITFDLLSGIPNFLMAFLSLLSAALLAFPALILADPFDDTVSQVCNNSLVEGFVTFSSLCNRWLIKTPT